MGAWIEICMSGKTCE